MEQGESSADEADDTDFNWMINFINQLEDSIDGQLEAELQCKIELAAKISTIKTELEANRFGQSNKMDGQEAFEYAKAVERLRLEARDLENKLGNLQIQNQQRSVSELQRKLYNVAEDGKEKAARIKRVKEKQRLDQEKGLDVIAQFDSDDSDAEFPDIIGDATDLAVLDLERSASKIVEHFSKIKGVAMQLICPLLHFWSEC